ncbi:serine hydrolase, partial [Mycobacterium sp.]|uniref:serine hydrolase n=1 Tax=Mycobacterium sp. TaxID=1785 RepID=UPI003C7848C3
GAVGNGQPATTLGDWPEGPAWSTIKVPLVIAAYRQRQPPTITDQMKAAITDSDNAAAESLWEQLGDPGTAAQKVQQMLQETGDPTTVESRKLRPEFTAFGQTIWSLVNEVRFIASAFCSSENDPIFDLMRHIEPDQKWGIGNIGDTPFKGGWGPSPSGKYLVRQIGVLTTPAGKVAVAIAAEPASGSFEDGTKNLNEVVRWLTDHLGALPAGQCNR